MNKNEAEHLRQKIAQRYEDRREVFEIYGDTCACCGSQDFLEIDHLYGDGSAHRADIAPQRLETWLRENGYPPEFQVLCRRCNMSKGTGDQCDIDHSKDMPIENNNIKPKTRADAIKTSIKGVVESEQASSLETLSTRISAKKKLLLLAQAKTRGCAVGQIIEELMDDQSHTKIIQLLESIYRKLDSIIGESRDEGLQPPLDPYAYRNIAPISDSTPDPQPPVMKRRWWQR